MIIKASFDHVKTISLPPQTYLAGGSASHKINNNGEIRKNKLEKKVDNNRSKSVKTLFGRVNKEVVRKKINAYYHYYKDNKSFYFYSISFPRDIPDSIAKQAFNTWLTRLRKLKNNMSYIWVAERQKNNTIHFHLIINEFYDIKTVNAYMSHSIDTLIKKYKLQNINYQIDRYNGVDVTKVTNHKTLSAYITKYVTKAACVIEGRAWGCSRDISKMFTEVVITADEWDNVKNRYKEYKTFKKEIPGLNTIVTIKYYNHTNEEETEFTRLLNNLNECVLNWEEQ